MRHLREFMKMAMWAVAVWVSVLIVQQVWKLIAPETGWARFWTFVLEGVVVWPLSCCGLGFIVILIMIRVGLIDLSDDDDEDDDDDGDVPDEDPPDPDPAEASSGRWKAAAHRVQRHVYRNIRIRM